MKLHKRWVTILTLVAFLGGSFALAIPDAAAAQTCAMTMTSPAGDDGGVDQTMSAAFKSPAPTCYDASGCIIAKTLSFLPAPSFAPTGWVRVKYGLWTPSWTGRAIKPEHGPPITLL